MARLPSDGVPYSLFTMAGLIPWSYFSASLTAVSTSVVSGSGLLTKVYFPRLILPLSSLGAGLIDVAVQLLLLSGLMAWYGFVPGWQIVLLPLFVGFTVITTLAFGLWLTALNVRYRDVGHAVPFFLQSWMWISPIVYSSQLVPEKWQHLYSLNPMVGVIDGFRWSVLGTVAPSAMSLIVSSTMITALLFSGLIYFRQQEATFADVV
jgi:lipopolysaccharide transport system permease protein